MRARIVNETERFTRGGDPYSKLGVGTDSRAHKKEMYVALEKRGISFWLSHMNFTPDERKDYLIDNIHEITELVDILEGAGVDPANMLVPATDHVTFQHWNIMLSNRVMTQCLTEEDANIVINILNDMATEERGFHYKKGNETFYITDKTVKFLGNLPANRKKYRSLGNPTGDRKYHRDP